MKKFNRVFLICIKQIELYIYFIYFIFILTFGTGLIYYVQKLKSINFINYLY